MAFPTTSLIDNFTRANQDPVASGWAGPVFLGGGQLKLTSNAVEALDSLTSRYSYWDTSFAADQEAWATVVTIPESPQSVSVQARIQQAGTGAADFYTWVYTIATGWRTYKVIDETWTQIGSTVGSPTLANGDSIGIEVIGTTIRGMHKTSGTWSQIMSNTDSAITAAGRIGISIASVDAVVDDFGGGAVVTGQTILPDADTAEGGWTTAPLFSKVNDSSDATIITATAS